MVEQFELEGRGMAWVSEGKLQRREVFYSPNFHIAHADALIKQATHLLCP